ncbi:lysophospholipid acyltransferase LPEAT2 isoform X2 [Punica granatum]|uniref:Lysophospholipid acyltransferase LPEAT2 isoform X2 n=2 Tax=Punica granatum TaxID=22663 RepID=A0A218VY95_PUNGR|nr:lysophospholipid acyltransferase LPEAT2 isoform X2 [Punica granatum]OWM64981.1 hypothetical protein CDL15_Pgr028699 [Punica granatum]
MAHPDLTSPLLPTSAPRPQHSAITIDDTPQTPKNTKTHPQNHNHHHGPHNNTQTAAASHPSPYEFLGGRPFSAPTPSTVDPFKNDTEKIDGVYELLKIVICLPIAAVRLLIFGVALGIGYLATKLALEGWKDKQNPMPAWRCRLMWVTRVCARCILFSFGYHWIRRKGKPAPRDIAPIVVSNHVSYIEPIFYFYELFPTMVASESHDSLPFVGTIIRAMQVIYVNRFSPSSRKHAVNEIKRKAACDRFPRVLLFPEGTTTNGKFLISFQLGAFIPGFAIQPVVVRYPHMHFDQSWGNISLGRLMFRMFTQFHNFMEVEYLPVVFPLENQKEIPTRFAKRTRQVLARALNVAQTSHSFGDIMLLTKASELQQENPSNYLVEMAQVESLFHINSLEAVNFLDKFLSMKPDSSGHVTIDGFLSALKLRFSNLTDEVFHLIDVDNNGYITFKQFLFASAHVMKQPLFRQACEQAFREYDVGGNDHVSEEQFGESIRPAVPEMTKDEIHELFGLFDADGDGRSSREEFLTCLRKNPLLIVLFSPQLGQAHTSGNGETTSDDIV